MTPPSSPAEVEPAPARSGRWLALATTAALTLAVIVYQGPHLRYLFEPDDTNHLETPLARVVAAQLEHGPAGLYGPFSGARPEVLIHAPLDYRLAALIAWPLVRLGFAPTLAALAGGRLLSLAGLGLALWGAARIVQLDRRSPRAGLWAGLLIAASPLVGSLPVTLRPDLPGLGLQLAGLALVLGWLGKPGPRPNGSLLVGAVSLALSIGMRQNQVVVVGLLAAVLVGAVALRRAPAGPVAAALGLGLGAVLAYYGLEEWLTAGQMHRAVFALPARFGQIAPAGWSHAVTVGVEAASRSIGWVALGLALMVAGPWGRPGRVDGLLAGIAAFEAGLAVVLCRNSTGAWVNYFMPAVVFLSLLLARGLDRVVERPPAPWRLAPLAIALLLIVARDADLARDSALARGQGRAELAEVLAHPALAGTTAEARYFAGDPARNRLAGNPALTHDEWLYSRFEAVDAAEPRRRWLAESLLRGPVRIVLVPDDGRRDPGEVSGLDRPLDVLGYAHAGRAGGMHLWTRPDPGADSPRP